MPTASSSLPAQSRTLADVLEAEEMAADGTSKEELVELLKKLYMGSTSSSSSNSDLQKSLSSGPKTQTLIAQEFDYFANVYKKEQSWRAAEREEELEDEHEITDFARNLVAITKYTPLRLSPAERAIFKILDSALTVSEYSDNVDILHRGVNSKGEVIERELLVLCSILSGLVCGHGYEKAQKLIFKKNLSSNLANNSNLYKKIFELGRRAKLGNPEVMRSNYGKLLFLLQDSRVYPRALDFELVGNNGKDLMTVHSFLIKKHRDDAEMFLKEPLLEVAIAEIHAEPDAMARELGDSLLDPKTGYLVEGALESLMAGKFNSKGNHIGQPLNPLGNVSPVFGALNCRPHIQAAKKKKQEAIDFMKSKYGRRTEAQAKASSITGCDEGVGDLLIKFLEEDSSSPTGTKMTPEQVELVLRSLQDAYSLLRFASAPIERIIQLMELHFDPKSDNADTPGTHGPGDLSIRSGMHGSCLSNNHSTQYRFVNQSLTLWKNIMSRLPELFQHAECDTLNNGYSLRDTGQGLNRLQSCPSVGKLMSEILNKTQRDCGNKGQNWVGLSVVHLGDRDVPNALVFIDKYLQVPKITGPVASVLDKIPVLYRNSPPPGTPGCVRTLIDEFGGPQAVVKLILRDFCRHAFDGSGDDGGSCVDGRLTSAWNWCSKLDKKVYYPVFLLCGWTGFDG